VKTECLTRQYFKLYFEKTRKFVDIQVHICSDRPRFGGYNEGEVAPFGIMYVHFKPQKKTRKKKVISLKMNKSQIFKAYQTKARKVRELESQKKKGMYVLFQQTKRIY